MVAESAAGCDVPNFHARDAPSAGRLHMRLRSQGRVALGRKTIMQTTRLAAGLLFALCTPVAAQTLGELSAAMGAHHQAAAIGSGSASVAHRARDTISRNLPKRGGELNAAARGEPKGAMRTASAGRPRGSWSGPARGWATGSSWARPGSARKR
jgi:hypothetical protein